MKPIDKSIFGMVSESSVLLNTPALSWTHTENQTSQAFLLRVAANTNPKRV
jgi:hypothetical protein